MPNVCWTFFRPYVVVFKCPLHCINILFTQILDYPRLDPRIRPWIIPMLTTLAQRSGLYPESFIVSGVSTEHTPFAGGAYGDIYNGATKDGRVLAIKVLMTYQTTYLRRLFKASACCWQPFKPPFIHRASRISLVRPSYGDNFSIQMSYPSMVYTIGVETPGGFVSSLRGW